MITKEQIDTLCQECVENDGITDSWDIAANIIHKLVNRSACSSDAEYFYNVKEVSNMVQDYIESTYYDVT